jgi:transglutaminase-like putative cysteine protease
LDSLAHDYYESIRAEKAPLNPSYQADADFYAELSEHDQGKIFWTDLDNEYYAHTSAHRYTQAELTLLSILYLSGADNATNNVDRMACILSYVDSKIHYQYDLVDRPFAPTETLSSGTGDCEDYSILVSALFELAGIPTAIATFTNSANEGHAMVLVHMSNLGNYNSYYYSDLTGYGLQTGKWILIEPQRAISQQHDPSWFLQWNIDAASET